jgi:choline-sulfatase
VEFHSLLPYIRDVNCKRACDAIYGCYLADRQRMVHVGDWKLIVYPRAKIVRLFNLAEDPQEMRGLAEDPHQKQRIRDLFGRLLKLQARMDDSLDLRAVFPAL